MDTYKIKQVNPLQLLKQNAPSVYAKVCSSQTEKLTTRLNNLRMLYRSTEDKEEKAKIEQEANELKTRLKEYKQ